MAAATVHSVIDGWAGDNKRQRVILTLATTNADTLAPSAVGLREIYAVQPTNRIGTLPGKTAPVTSVVAATVTSYTPSSKVLSGTAAKFEAIILGR